MSSHETIISDEMADELAYLLDVVSGEKKQRLTDAIDMLKKTKITELEYKPIATRCHNAVQAITKELHLRHSSHVEKENREAETVENPFGKDVALHPAFAQRVRAEQQAAASNNIQDGKITQLRETFLVRIGNVYAQSPVDSPLSGMSRI